MNNFDKMFDVCLTDLKNGYQEEEDYFLCLICGMKIEKGIIYKIEDKLLEAQKYVKTHIKNEHDSVFNYLINLDKKITGLSEHQNKLIKLFYEGKTDTEIQVDMGIGSSSTVRNHRFLLKEKERQARIFLVLTELLKENGKKSHNYIEPHKTAKIVDERYNLTMEENDEILNKYFPKGLNSRLKTFHMKEKSKIAVLRHLLTRFEAGRLYREKEVNEILKSAYDDFATLRRYMIEYGLLDRKPDGSSYWVKQVADKKKEEKNMDRRKELKEQYKETKQEAGVYQIRNTKNNKVFVLATSNLRTINGKRFQLNMGGFMNEKLQEDWNKFGEKAFTFDILEVLEEPEEGFFDKKEELKKLEKKWFEKLQPFGEKGYNSNKIKE